MRAMDGYLADKATALRGFRAAVLADPRPKPMTATCRAVGRNGVREIRIRDFQVITDAPPAMGGAGLGPSAPEILLGAFASCLVHTAVILAADRGLSLDAVEAQVTAGMPLAAGLPGYEDTPFAPRNLTYRLDIRSAEPADRITALRAEVERRCPIFNLLKDPQSITGGIVHAAPAPGPEATTAPSRPRMRIGVIGAGFIGRGLARLAVKAGHEVMISNSRGPESLGSTVVSIGCKAGTAEDAAAFGDVVFVAIPLRTYRSIPVAPLVGKVVVDANNHYPHRDGPIPELDRKETTTSELLAWHLPGSKIVKAFNAILERDLEKDGRPTGTPGRRALPIAGDDAAAKATVTSLLDEFGYDAVDAGPLAEGWRFQRAMPGYCVPLDAAGMKAALAAADRDVEVPHGSWRQARPA